jgi:hypothetical protein
MVIMRKITILTALKTTRKTSQNKSKHNKT